jgi:hypothetical protein
LVVVKSRAWWKGFFSYMSCSMRLDCAPEVLGFGAFFWFPAEFADGSIMFRFGTDEECNDSLGHSGAEEVDGISTLQKDLREKEIDSAGINGVSTAQKGSMETLQKQEAQVAESVDLQRDLAAGEAGTSDDVLGTSWKDQTALLGDAEIAPDTGDVPDPTTLSSIVAVAVHLVEEIDEKVDFSHVE